MCFGLYAIYHMQYDYLCCSLYILVLDERKPTSRQYLNAYCKRQQRTHNIIYILLFVCEFYNGDYFQSIRKVSFDNVNYTNSVYISCDVLVGGLTLTLSQLC